MAVLLDGFAVFKLRQEVPDLVEVRHYPVVSFSSSSFKEQGKMAQTGTLAALKELFSARRTVDADTVLTPADIGRTILVDATAGVTITLPAITGDAGAGINGIGNNGQIAIVVAVAGALVITSPGGTPDTFNDGQAFDITTLITQNSFGIFVSNGAAVAPGDWLALLHVA